MLDTNSVEGDAFGDAMLRQWLIQNLTPWRPRSLHKACLMADNQYGFAFTTICSFSAPFQRHWETGWNLRRSVKLRSSCRFCAHLLRKRQAVQSSTAVITPKGQLNGAKLRTADICWPKYTLESNTIVWCSERFHPHFRHGNVQSSSVQNPCWLTILGGYTVYIWVAICILSNIYQYMLHRDT